MKIAFLNIYNGVIERGSEVFVREIAAKLSQKHFVNIFQTGEKEKEKYKIQQISGIPFKPYSLFYNFWVLIFTLKCLPYLWKEKYDWIIPINGRWQILICRFLRFLRGGKILISGHAGVGFEDRLNLVLGKPDIFVALTPTAFYWAKKIYPKGKIFYIPNGVDIERFSPNVSPQELGLPKPIILCVSALQSYKRVELLIRAVSQLPGVSLLVIGDGPLRENIISLGNKLLEKRFCLISYVPFDKIAHYYSSAQIFSLPSLESEAFGLVYLEALACNVPVVAPNYKNRKEIIGEGGVYFDPENINDYIRKLQEALEINFGREPRIQAEKFSWGKITQKYEEIMEEH